MLEETSEVVYRLFDINILIQFKCLVVLFVVVVVIIIIITIIIKGPIL